MSRILTRVLQTPQLVQLGGFRFRWGVGRSLGGWIVPKISERRRREEIFCSKNISLHYTFCGWQIWWCLVNNIRRLFGNCT